MSLERNEAFADLEALLNANMEDLDDLPPMGVPPTGNYNLSVTIEKATIGDDNKEVLKAEYEVLTVNEVKNADEASDVQAGQKFTEFFHATKKDGAPNPYGIAALKERLKPFQEAAGTANIGALVGWVKNITIAATVVRTVNKKNEDQYNMRLKDVVVL